MTSERNVGTFANNQIHNGPHMGMGSVRDKLGAPTQVGTDHEDREYRQK